MNRSAGQMLSMVALLALCMCAAGTAHADHSFLTSCSASVNPLIFGNYDVFNTSPTTTATTATVTCTTYFFPDNVSYTVSISGGSNSTANPRHMTSGTDQLQYNLYQQPYFNDWPPSTSSICPPTSGGGCQIRLKPQRRGPDTGTDTFTIYGSIPAGQDVSAGTYQDTLTLTIDY